MSWEFDQFGGERNRKLDHRVLGIEPGLPDLHLVEALAPAAPHGIGQCRGDVLGQPERLADIADRAARPVMDDGGDDRGAVTAVAAVEKIHYLPPARMV